MVKRERIVIVVLHSGVHRDLSVVECLQVARIHRRLITWLERQVFVVLSEGVGHEQVNVR